MSVMVWFKRLSLIACLLALCVVVLGAYVRLSDAGLGCPDWPGCYGTLTVPQSEAAIQEAQKVYPQSVVVVHKAWKEMVHRYFASILGLLILAICVLGWKARDAIKVSPWFTTGLVGLVGLQGALGMWTVTMLLKPAIVSAHLLGGMSTLAMLTWVAHRHWADLSTQSNLTLSHGLRTAIRGALLVIFMQIFLGGWTSTNYAALACNDFPTCHGAWLPNMDFGSAFHMVRELGQGVDGKPLTLEALSAIQWTHRLGAVLTFLYLSLLTFALFKNAQLKRLGLLLITLLCLQVAIGIANLVLHLPMMLAVAHNLGAALLLITIVIMNSKITDMVKRG